MMTRPRSRRRTGLWLLRWLAHGLVWLVILWGVGFAVYLVSIFNTAPPNPLPAADGIVVLTGGDDRISTALALLQRRAAPLLLISGAGKGTYLGDFTADNRNAATLYADAITLGHDATTTHQNGEETAVWAKAHHLHVLIVVTADYQMARALLEIQRALPQARLIAYPVSPPAMRGPFTGQTLLMLADEYSKYLVVRAGMGRFFSPHQDGNY